MSDHHRMLTDEAGRIDALQRYQLLDTPPEQSFDRITGLIARSLNVPIVLVSLVDRERIWFKSHYGTSLEQTDRCPGLCASAIAYPDPYVVTDARGDERTSANPLVTGDVGIRFYLGVPLRTPDGYHVGMLCAIDMQPRAPSATDIALLADLAQVVVDEMELRLALRRAEGLTCELSGAQSEIDVLKHKLRVAIRVAEEANHLKTQFLANMSHELRTPLNAILNFTKFLSKDRYGKLTERQQELQQRVLANAEHLLDLINDILDLAKIDSGSIVLESEPCDLLPVLHRVMATAVGLTRDKGLLLDSEVPDVLPLVLIDRSRVRQVLLNLLSNAAKFTKQGRVTLRACVVADMVRIAIEDTGIGIEPEHMTLIFEEFRQVQGGFQREQQGTGLGLPISKRLVEMHGGTIWAESIPDVGSTFYFTLPLARTTIP